MSDPTVIKALLGEYAEYPCTPEQEARIMRLRASDEQKKQAQDFEHLKSMAHKAQSGVYGKAAQDLAREFMAANADSRMNLETLRKLLRKVPGRISG